jgi:DNA-directed RNA polymerase specialized sigma24 family protein
LAGEAFAAAYSRGARVLFRHHLGTVAVDHLVEETIDGALEAIRSGEIQSPRHLVAFLRSVVEREKRRRIEETVPVAGSSDRWRIRRKAEAIAQQLRSASPLEREVLLRYYVQGEPAAAVIAVTGISPERFESLRELYYEAAAAAVSSRPKVGLSRPRRLSSAAAGA